jgi:hypothetical protein
MTTGTPRGSRMPRDTRTRERLREAQQRESESVAAVCAATDVLHKAYAKREAAIAAATSTVEQAQAAVEAAEATLVTVSGIDRAALLLGIEPTELRKITTTRTGRKTDA